MNAGTTTIRVSSADNSITASCTVHVVIEDGVYYIKNASSGKYLRNNGGNVIVFAQDTSANTKFNQLWKITYVGNGRYAIRPMDDTSEALTIGTSSYIAVADATLSNAALPSSYLWTISRDGSGIYFQQNGASNKTITTQVNGTTTIIYPGTYSSSTACHWTLEGVKGVYLRDRNTSEIIPPSTVKYVVMGETLSLSQLGIVYDTANYSSSNPEWISANDGIANVNVETGAVTGEAPGKVTITLTVTIDDTDYRHSYELCVMFIPEGTYFIGNGESNKYIDIEDQTMANGTTIHQWEFHGGDTQRWVFTYQPDGTYTIHSANSETRYYLGVSGDSIANDQPVVLRTGEIGNGMKWNVVLTDSGAFKLIPLTGEANDRVLALYVGLLSSVTANGNILRQRDYSDDNNYKDEWMLFQAEEKIENPDNIIFVKLEVMYDAAYISKYPDAALRIARQTKELQKKYLSEFGIWINCTVPIQFSSYADQNCDAAYDELCTHCTNEECADSISYTNGLLNLKSLHHTNIMNILLRIPSLNAQKRFKLAYIGRKLCQADEDGQGHGSDPGAPLGLAIRSQGVIGVMCQSATITETEETQVMIHEFGHLFKVDDHYGYGTTSTDQIIADTGDEGYNRLCIYGEDNAVSTVTSSYLICDGCKAQIEQNKSNYDHR